MVQFQFLIFFLCFYIVKSVLSSTVPLSQPKSVPKCITDTVIHDPEIIQPPNEPKEYLKSGVYYGGKRSKLFADDLFEKANKMKLPFHNYQIIKYNQNDLVEKNYLPGSPRNLNEWEDDAFSIYKSCRIWWQDRVDKLNSDCGSKCKKTFMLAAIWGNLEGMNWNKDLIFFDTCGIISVENSEKCFKNFPDSCSIQFHGQDRHLFKNETINSGDIVEFGNSKPKPKTQLIEELRTYAEKSHKSITIPSN